MFTLYSITSFTLITHHTAGMTQEANGLEAHSKYPQAEGSHARRMASLQADIKDIQDSIKELQENER